jgi:hypothetical protein
MLAAEVSHWKLDEEREVTRWKAVMDWWSRKCSYCAGQGLGGSDILHELQECTQGCSTQISRRVGLILYRDWKAPHTACSGCFLPKEMCAKWTQDYDDVWVENVYWACQYGRHLACDIVIRLFQCGRDDLKRSLLDSTRDRRAAIRRAQTGSDNAVAHFLAR